MNQLRNDLCDFNGAYIVVTDKITATDADPPDDINYDRDIALKNSAHYFQLYLKNKRSIN